MKPYGTSGTTFPTRFGSRLRIGNIRIFAYYILAYIASYICKVISTILSQFLNIPLLYALKQYLNVSDFLHAGIIMHFHKQYFISSIFLIFADVNGKKGSRNIERLAII